MVEIRTVSAVEFGTNGSSPMAAQLRHVVEACDAADKVLTLNEQARLQLQYHGLRDATLWIAPSAQEGSYDGFALLRGENLDLAVHPDERNRGIGTALAAVALTRIANVEAWSHADHPAATRIATRFGVPRERELKVMTRSTSLPVEEVAPSEGITIRTFRADDEAGLLKVNARAFAHHPEQGNMTHDDFAERSGQDWFDPAGLFVAVDEADNLLGFHWTKVHRDESPAYGEVYVVAVSPEAAGHGIGKSLTAAGLAHLSHSGVGEVILYVDGDNDAALAVYRNQGFDEVRTEVQYRGRPTLP